MITYVNIFVKRFNVMKKFAKLIRLKHYVKNFLILLPIVFGKQVFNASILSNVLWGFLSFCALSSAVYIFNDLCDMQRDKKHPQKKHRPIASGAVSKKEAVALIFILISICALTNSFASKSCFSWLLILVYLLQNILYSLKLKEFPIIDTTILASGFFIRVFYGSDISGIVVSKWLYLTVIAMSFFLGFAKRRNEKKQNESETRMVLKHYSYDFLDKNMYVFFALTIVFYSLWSVDNTTIEYLGSNAIIWTVPIVILICISFSLAIEKSEADDPVDIIFDNKLLIVLIAVYGICVMGIIYFK